MKKSAHAQFELRYHLVFVTKFRRKALTGAMLESCEEVMRDVLEKWDCHLMEFGGEPDHVHLLFEAPPTLELSVLVNNLKTVSARRLRAAFPAHLRRFYWKPMLWHRSYYLGSVGNASLATVMRYVDQQAGAD